MIIREYRVNQGEICFLGSMSDILNYYRFNISEFFILGMGPGLQFRIKNCHTDEICSLEYRIETVDLNKDFKEFEELFSNLGFSINKNTFDKFEDIENNLVLNLIDKRPVMVDVDVFNLKYHVDYEKTHHAHIVVIYGIDKENGKFFIADSYITTLKKSNYMGALELVELPQILDLTQVKSTKRYICWNMLRSSANHPFMSTDVAKKIRNSGKKIKNSSNRNGWISGLDAIRQFNTKINELSRLELTSEIKSFLELIYKMLTGFGGPTATRKLFGQFLYWGITNAGIKIPETIADRYIELAKKWGKFSRLLMKTVILEDIQYLHKADKEMQEIVIEEEQLAEIISHIQTSTECKIGDNVF